MADKMNAMLNGMANIAMKQLFCGVTDHKFNQALRSSHFQGWRYPALQYSLWTCRCQPWVCSGETDGGGDGAERCGVTGGDAGDDDGGGERLSACDSWSPRKPCQPRPPWCYLAPCPVAGSGHCACSLWRGAWEAYWPAQLGWDLCDRTGYVS